MKLLIIGVGIVAAAVASIFVLTSSISGEREMTPPILNYPPTPEKDRDEPTATTTTLTVMTLNIAHGRKVWPNQMFQSGSGIKSNLDDIVTMLKREQPDLVALQEADGPSLWSGRFNHVEYVARNAGYFYSTQGAHTSGIGLTYGTALLSKYPLQNPVSITFPSSPPTFPKGYVGACVGWSSEPESTVEIVSVHFDFSRHSVRKQQARDMINRFSAVTRPRILMGDFNCQWGTGESPLNLLAAELNLTAYREHADDLVTFPGTGGRLDWILISPEFEFVSYRVVPDILSDHRAVVSEIRKK